MAARAAIPGGDGIVREYEMLCDTDVTVLSERRRESPWGAQGGGPGATGRNTVIHAATGVAKMSAPRCGCELHAGDRLSIETSWRRWLWSGTGLTADGFLVTCPIHQTRHVDTHHRSGPDCSPSSARPRPRRGGPSSPPALGWMLDSFDVMLYALVLASLMTDLGHRQADGGLSRLADADCRRRRRHRLRRHRRSLRPHARADCQRHHLLHLHGGLRPRAERGAARGVPRLPRHRHGRRVGEWRGAGVRNLAGRAPRQGARPDAERLGHRLRRRGHRHGHRSARVRAGARCSSSVYCRRS